MHLCVCCGHVSARRDGWGGGGHRPAHTGAGAGGTLNGFRMRVIFFLDLWIHRLFWKKQKMKREPVCGAPSAPGGIRRKPVSG